MVVRGFPVAQLDSRPFDLNVCLLPSRPRQLGFGGETREKGGEQGFGVRAGHVVCSKQPPELWPAPLGSPAKLDPHTLTEGGQELQGSPLGLAKQGF